MFIGKKLLLDVEKRILNNEQLSKINQTFFSPDAFKESVGAGDKFELTEEFDTHTDTQIHTQTYRHICINRRNHTHTSTSTCKDTHTYTSLNKYTHIMHA